MTKRILQLLFDRYFSGSAGKEECAELLEHIHKADQEQIEEAVTEIALKLDEGPDFNIFLAERILSRIKADPLYLESLHKQDPETVHEQGLPARPVYPYYRRILFKAITACMLFAVSGLAFRAYQYRRKLYQHTTVKLQLSPPRKFILPGSDRATLTLSNGAVIILDSAKKGILAREGNVPIYKSSSGRLVYRDIPTGSTLAGPVAYNSISTPRGGQYQLVLPDGTQVWLNAASSLRYPAQFAGLTREVTLTGEAYFEVAKDRLHPFRVLTSRQQVEVLGTHFNINDYDDEPSVKTTLAEGSVKIISGGNTLMLRPDEQAVVNNNSTGIISVSKVDVERVVAWKNGNFEFENAEIPVIMRQVSRWYDVEVAYGARLSQKRFTGSISRNISLKDLLTMLGYTGLNFKVTGMKILISN